MFSEPLLTVNSYINERRVLQEFDKLLNERSVTPAVDPPEHIISVADGPPGVQYGISWTE